jgi:hypothetical protein
MFRQGWGNCQQIVGYQGQQHFLFFQLTNISMADRILSGTLGA